ncbi:MAG: FAD-dependent oxidoreductase [Candidatus Rokubacteria bacterium]|nr:FAD-dependent oxidoreductase [Candidatus Rokubacteria bacterium]
MSVDLGPARPLGWSEPGRTTLEIPTGGWRTRRPVYVEARAPCAAACPAGEPVPRWVERARQGDYAGAWALVREANPFPAVTGRVCAHPCEAACHRWDHDGAVAVHALERFVGDWGLAHGRPAPPAARRPERVAVVGGGPAGLSCAYHLGRLGYRVTVYERMPALGGLLRYGIPAYRLPRAVLDREIDSILGLGLEVRTGTAVGRDVPWEALDGYDAVFLAVGAGIPLRLGVPGEDHPAVGDGLAFLRAVNTGSRPAPGGRVVVVGGGSTAMDVARTALRLGARSVTVLALEAREAMPAAPDEVEQALAEGVEIRNGVGVRAFVEKDGCLCGVEVSAATLEQAPDGTVRPVFLPGPSGILETDTTLLAIGQRPDPASLVAAEAGGAGGPVRYAGGDMASGFRTVSHAIGAGAGAARLIHARLAGVPPEAAADLPGWVAARPAHVVTLDEIRLDAFPRAPRCPRPHRAAARPAGFTEVVPGLDEAAAREEARRCLTCGRCVACDVCLLACPDMAIRRVDGGYAVASEYCKGCGLCARECPRGALQMGAER